MLQENPLNKEAKMKHACCVKCVSWSAIIVGSFVAIGLGFLLNLFGLSIGLSLLSMNPEGSLGIAAGGFIALLIGTIAIMFVAGWVSGYLGREHATNPNVGALYGFTTWCLALIITIFIAANMAEYISMNNSAMSKTPVSSSLQEQAQGLLMGGVSGKHAAAKQGGGQAAASGPNVLEETLFLTFLLFFIGAIASCVGGYSGLNLRCKSEGK